ncbi:hypothetical protein ABKN59_004795 [Abortiporus biennis]
MIMRSVVTPYNQHMYKSQHVFLRKLRHILCGHQVSLCIFPIYMITAWRQGRTRRLHDHQTGNSINMGTGWGVRFHRTIAVIATAIGHPFGFSLSLHRSAHMNVGKFHALEYFQHCLEATDNSIIRRYRGVLCRDVSRCSFIILYSQACTYHKDTERSSRMDKPGHDTYCGDVLWYHFYRSRVLSSILQCPDGTSNIFECLNPISRTLVFIGFMLAERVRSTSMPPE